MKIDERKARSRFYPTGKKAAEPHLVDVPSGLFVMADGQGDPNDNERFEEVLGMLYAVSYGAKFASKALGRDYAVMPLEGLWWAQDLNAFELDRRDAARRSSRAGSAERQDHREAGSRNSD